MCDDQETWDAVIDGLRGTCNSLDSECETHGAPDLVDHMPFLEHLDQEIFACTACGWWCGIDEEVSEEIGHDELICRDCAQEEHD
jgi:anaerobic selenocysteine-containing dehydrogenase